MFKIFKCFQNKKDDDETQPKVMRLKPLTETEYYTNLVSATRNTLIDATDKQVIDIVNLALSDNLTTDNNIVNQYGLTKSFIDAYLYLTKMDIENVRRAEKSTELFNQEREVLFNLIKSDFKTVYNKELDAELNDMVLTFVDSDSHLGRKIGIRCKEAYYEIWTKANTKPVKTLIYDYDAISRSVFKLHEHWVKVI